MAGIVGHNRDQPAIHVCAQHRQRLVHRATGRPPVFRESHAALRPRQRARPASLQRLTGDLFQLVNQLARVTVDDLLVLRGNVTRKNVRRPTRGARPSVRVRTGDDQPLRLDAPACGQASRHFEISRFRNAAIVERQQQRWSLPSAANRQRLGPELLLDAGGRCGPAGITRESNWDGRGDLNARHAHVHLGALCGRREKYRNHRNHTTDREAPGAEGQRGFHHQISVKCFHPCPLC